MTIAAVGVVVPARNEEELLPPCLDALLIAARAIAPVPVHVVVVLDSCTDASADVVAVRPWVTSLRVEAGNVGVARRAGTDVVLAEWAERDPTSTWIATTDADSVVPPDWLAGQLALAADGWEVVVGTVRVDDWTGRLPGVAQRWADSYQAIEHHRHVHGANLGFSAAAYRASGGWPADAAHEDVGLLHRLADRRIVRTATLAVTTSARCDPRAANGFGETLSGLAG